MEMAARLVVIGLTDAFGKTDSEKFERSKSVKIWIDLILPGASFSVNSASTHWLFTVWFRHNDLTPCCHDDNADLLQFRAKLCVCVNRPCLIIWHFYCVRLYSDVIKYLTFCGLWVIYSWKDKHDSTNKKIKIFQRLIAFNLVSLYQSRRGNS